MFDSDLLDDFKIFLPKYLSEESQKKLFDELKRFPSNINERFYTSKQSNPSQILQGDGFSSVPIADYEHEIFKKAKGILLSNSCDASPSNKRIYIPYLSFAPIINLEKWERVLLEEGHDKNSVEGHIKSIQKQKITQFFFLPKRKGLDSDCFVRFDRMFSIPFSEIFNRNLTKERIFTLSNYGFYIFLFKLSIHFTRVQERIDREE